METDEEAQGFNVLCCNRGEMLSLGNEEEAKAKERVTLREVTRHP